MRQASRDALYDQDALAWADRQAGLLRLVAAGQRVNEPVDWPHVIEEIRDVGLSELRACQSLLQQAMTHLLKLHAWPESLACAHWRDEAGVFLDDAARRLSPSMSRRIALDELYAKALRRARAAADDAGPARALPDACPFVLDELLDGDVKALAASIGQGPGPAGP